MSFFGTARNRLQATRWAVGLALGLAALAASAMDDPPGRVGRVSDVQGRAWLMEGGQGEWSEQLRNRPLTTGDRLNTDRDARLQLQIGSTVLQLGGGADLQVMRLDDDRIELMLVSGSLGLRVREPEVAREIDLRVGENHFTPRGPGSFRIDQDSRSSFGAAITGELAFEARDAALTLRSGQRAEFWFDAGDGRTHYSWASLPGDEQTAWLQRPVYTEERRPEARYVSPEMTGAEDLDRYGRWSTHPEYGAVWSPVGISVGWAPYRYGHWAWVSPWGWTWVDDAPWGFAPFHYGRWMFWAGSWCWVPGRYVHRPVYAPAMVAWVGQPGVSVSVGVGANVGWVPLAPREVYYPSYRTTPRYLDHLNRPYGQVPPPQAPREPVMYTNRGVPGGVTMVPSQALQRQAVVPVAQQRLDDGAVQRVLRDERPGSGPGFVPPAPQGAHQNVRVVPTPAAVLAQPQPRALPPKGNEPYRGMQPYRDPEQPVAQPPAARPVAPAQVMPVAPASPQLPRGELPRGEAPRVLPPAQRPQIQAEPPAPPQAPARQPQAETPRPMPAPQVEPPRPAPRVLPVERPAERSPAHPADRPQVQQAPQMQAQVERAPARREREDERRGGNPNNRRDSRNVD